MTLLPYRKTRDEGRQHDGKFYGHDTMQRIAAQKPRRSLDALWAVLSIAVIAAIAVAAVISL
jgi:hypothetical protein